jgi:endoglucanase
MIGRSQITIHHRRRACRNARGAVAARRRVVRLQHVPMDPVVARARRCPLPSSHADDHRRPARSWRVSVRPLAFAALGCALSVALRAAPPPLHVEGNRLLDSSGHAPRLRGVNCAGLEWATDGDGHTLRTVREAVEVWHANIIRLPLSQDRWVGKGPEQTNDGVDYRILVRQVADYCSAHDVYLMTDLHWSDAGAWGKNIGQHNLPDANSVEFWRYVAKQFKNEPAVLFDLYNEPSHVDWDQWLRGGPMTEIDENTKATLTYQGVGMQALIDAIRATGAKNLIVAGGINWAYEVEGILPDRVLHDPDGQGILYAVHPYPHAYAGLGRETIDQWAARMEKFGATLPFIVAEFGSIERMWAFPKDWNMSDEKWNRAMLATLDARGWNWIAWDFHPTAWPCLIADWDYTPTPEFGVWVKRALAANRGD